jgi:hypothetical protein
VVAITLSLFTTEETAAIAFGIGGLLDPVTRLGEVVNRQIFFPYHEANLDFLVVLPAAYSQY